MIIDLEPEHLALFNLLYQAGIFSIKNGSAEIHFNSDGAIAAIEVHQKVYRRPVDKIVAVVSEIV